MTSCPDLEVYEAAESAFLQQIELVKSIPGAQIAMNTQPIPSSASRACDSRGGNPLGLKAVPQQCMYKNLGHFYLALTRIRARDRDGVVTPRG